MNAELWVVIAKHVCGGSPGFLDCARNDVDINITILYNTLRKVNSNTHPTQHRRYFDRSERSERSGEIQA